LKEKFLSIYEKKFSKITSFIQFSQDLIGIAVSRIGNFAELDIKAQKVAIIDQVLNENILFVV
jgi:hypothetical protein